jgi:hypothetical protein
LIPCTAICHGCRRTAANPHRQRYVLTALSKEPMIQGAAKLAPGPGNLARIYASCGESSVADGARRLRCVARQWDGTGVGANVEGQVDDGLKTQTPFVRPGVERFCAESCLHSYLLITSRMSSAFTQAVPRLPTTMPAATLARYAAWLRDAPAAIASANTLNAVSPAPVTS